MANATVTLSTTTLARVCSLDATQIEVASSAGLTPGIRLYVDREMMSVVSLSPVTDPFGLGVFVNVIRGQDGTKGSAHAAGSTAVIGLASQFYATNPMGLPPESLPVSPYINVQTGVYWYALGDDAPEGQANRWFQSATLVRGTTSLGIRTVQATLPESTAP